jgi:hypothetical protein
MEYFSEFFAVEESEDRALGVLTKKKKRKSEKVRALLNIYTIYI